MVGQKGERGQTPAARRHILLSEFVCDSNALACGQGGFVASSSGTFSLSATFSIICSRSVSA